MTRLQKRGLRGITAFMSVFLGGAMFTQGGVVYSTGFNSPTYSDGGLIGQDGWLITGSSVVNPIAVSNTATDGIVALANNGQDVNRVFTPASTSDSMFVAADITLSAAQATGDYFLHLGDGGSSNFYDRVYAKASGTGFVMALTTGSGSATSYGSTVLSFGTTYHIVARYDFVGGLTNDTGALYVNPVDPLGLTDTPYVLAQTTGADAVSISSVNLRQGSATAGPTLTIDNITVTSAPEPASIGLLAIAGLGLVRRKR